jgi:hypothetical protein
MISQPRTYNTMWAEYAEALRENDDGELPEDYETFALSEKPNLEME